MSDIDVSNVSLSQSEPTEAERQASANRSILRDQAKTNLAVLRTSIDTLKTVTDKTNANITPGDTKTVARETRRVARQLIAVTRLFLGELDTADTGTE